MDLETYELIKSSSDEDCKECMEKEAVVCGGLCIAAVAAGIAAVVGGGMAVYQGRKSSDQQTTQNQQEYEQQDADRLPGQGRPDPMPSNYPGQVMTGNPQWDALSQAYQEYLANRDGEQYGPGNYGPQFYTQRDYLDRSWGPARDPSLPVESGVPYAQAHLGYVAPENRNIWAWDTTTPGGLRKTMEMNYIMSQYGPRSGQQNFNAGWQEAQEQEAANLAAGENKFKHVEDAQKAYKDQLTPFKIDPNKP